MVPIRREVVVEGELGWLVEERAHRHDQSTVVDRENLDAVHFDDPVAQVAFVVHHHGRFEAGLDDLAWPQIPTPPGTKRAIPRIVNRLDTRLRRCPHGVLECHVIGEKFHP